MKKPELKEGQKWTATSDALNRFTPGKDYQIKKDSYGDIYIKDDNNERSYLTDKSSQVAFTEEFDFYDGGTAKTPEYGDVYECKKPVCGYFTEGKKYPIIVFDDGATGLIDDCCNDFRTDHLYGINLGSFHDHFELIETPAEAMKRQIEDLEKRLKLVEKVNRKKIEREVRKNYTEATRQASQSVKKLAEAIGKIKLPESEKCVTAKELFRDYHDSEKIKKFIELGEDSAYINGFDYYETVDVDFMKKLRAQMLLRGEQFLKENGVKNTRINIEKLTLNFDN